MRILVIEDDKSLAETLRFQLERSGFETDVCHDGEEGLHFIEQQAHDLILLDRMLPILDGISVLKITREKNIPTPIIFVTALGALNDKVTGLDCGADDYLVKPFDKEKFILVLDKAWKRAGKGKEELLMVKVSGGMRQIDPGLIIYCETQKNYQILYLREEQIKVRMTGGELYRILKNSSGFVRCGSSYIFNLNHIVAVDRDEIRTDAGNRILIPRNRAAEFKKMYFAFYFGRN